MAAAPQVTIRHAARVVGWLGLGLGLGLGLSLGLGLGLGLGEAWAQG